MLPNFYRKSLIKYHKDIIAKESDTQYDYVFFIQVHHFSLENIKQLRKSQSQSSFILYNWDSLTTHDYQAYLKYFDTVFTFDKADAVKLNIRYLSLFSLPEYFRVQASDKPFYDLYFVGAIVTLNRYKAIQELEKFCQSKNLNFKKYLQCSPYILMKLALKGFSIKGLSLKSISANDIIKIMDKSVAVFDFANHSQSGYTMRLIENMCAGKKIVTSNTNIIHEDFYSDDRFLLVKNLDFSELNYFLNKPITKTTSFHHFSLSHWVDKILETDI